jgi:hypothetical protein
MWEHVNVINIVLDQRDWQTFDGLCLLVSLNIPFIGMKIIKIEYHSHVALCLTNGCLPCQPVAEAICLIPLYFRFLLLLQSHMMGKSNFSQQNYS